MIGIHYDNKPNKYNFQIFIEKILQSFTNEQ